MVSIIRVEYFVSIIGRTGWMKLYIHLYIIIKGKQKKDYFTPNLITTK